MNKWLCGALLLLLTACGEPAPDATVQQLQQTLGTKSQHFLLCDDFKLRLAEAVALRGRQGLTLDSWSALLIHPQEGRAEAVDRAARDTGLTVKKTVAWNELNPVSQQVDRGTEPGDSFTTYHRPQDPENLYVFYDEQAVTRYDGFCIYRLHLPAGQTLKGD